MVDRKELVFKIITAFPHFDWEILKDYLEGKKEAEEVLYEIVKHAYERTRHSRYYYYNRPQRG